MIQEDYVQGISNRIVDDLVKTKGTFGDSKSQVSRLCDEIDGKVKTFLERPIEAVWPYLWIDATYMKAKRGGLVVSDTHEGLKVATTKVLSAAWLRFRVHFIRNMLAHAGKSGRHIVSACIATAFAHDTPVAAKVQWRSVATELYHAMGHDLMPNPVKDFAVVSELHCV